MKFSVKVKMTKVGAADGSAGEATVDKPEHLSLILGTRMVGKENHYSRLSSDLMKC